MSDKYWTAFAVKGLDPDVMHCTHKYLGALQVPLELANALSIVEEHFHWVPFRDFRVTFDLIERFGGDADVRVLTTQNMPVPIYRHEPLRRGLASYFPDTYPEYRPHVTTDALTGVLNLHFDRYVVMRNKDVVATWDASTKPLRDSAQRGKDQYGYSF